MGFRLEGAPLAHSRDAQMISDATAMGALQVPASGHPILLMADRQTTGGYWTIANVITADLGLAGQLAPGDSIAFVVCSPAEALSALIAQERRILAAHVGAGVTDFGELLVEFVRSSARPSGRGARTVHHLQGRRPADWLVDTQHRRDGDRAAACAYGGTRSPVLGGGQMCWCRTRAFVGSIIRTRAGAFSRSRPVS